MGIFSFGLKVGKTLKEGTKAIKSFNPKKSKFKSKSVDLHKFSATAAKIKQGSFEFKEGVTKAMKDIKKLKKITGTD